MPYMGVVLAWAAVVFANVVTLTWTNPPDLDLRAVVVYGTHPNMPNQKNGGGDTIQVAYYRGRNLDPTDFPDSCYIAPGRKDSLYVCLAPVADTTRWTFWLSSADTAGNLSLKSNPASWTQLPTR